MVLDHALLKLAESNTIHLGDLLTGQSELSQVFEDGLSVLKKV